MEEVTNSTTCPYRTLLKELGDELDYSAQGDVESLNRWERVEILEEQVAAALAAREAAEEEEEDNDMQEDDDDEEDEEEEY